MRRVALAGLIAAAAVASVYAWNYVVLYGPVSREIGKDERNAKVSVWTYFRYGVQPAVVVFDLRSVEETAASIDVMRVLLQAASTLKHSNFDRIILAHAGEPKFFLDGRFFKQVGEEFGAQNVVYTLRTFPENVYRLDGSPAYGTWTGGVLGVLGKQMEDLNTFAREWYVNDMVREAAKAKR
jgi:hypothetical protein